MKRDIEAALIGFYILRGHTLEEMLSLGTADKLIYAAAMELEGEMMKNG